MVKKAKQMPGTISLKTGNRTEIITKHCTNPLRYPDQCRAGKEREGW